MNHTTLPFFPKDGGWTMPDGSDVRVAASKIRVRESFFASPVHTNAMSRAAQSTEREVRECERGMCVGVCVMRGCKQHQQYEHGRVNVILCGGGLGESVMGATRAVRSCSNEWEGNREAVCPSGPMPARCV